MISAKFNLAIYLFIFLTSIIVIVVHCYDELVSTYSIQGL